MKSKKLTKKITSLIIEKKIKDFNFFTVELTKEAKFFFKKKKTLI